MRKSHRITVVGGKWGEGMERCQVDLQKHKGNVLWVLGLEGEPG